MARHVLARSMHDLGLAAWFGGSLMGSVGLNGAAASLRNADERTGAATRGWTRWAPISAAAIGAHLLGAAQLLNTESGRVRRQEGVGRSSLIKTVLTVGAVATTAYSGVLNRKMAAAGNVPAAGATEPGAGTPADVASAQKQLKAIQWAIPALTGALVSVTAWQSEQMRPRQQLLGSIGGVLRPVTSSAKPLAIASAGTGLFLASRRRSKSKSKSSGTSSSTGAGSSYGAATGIGSGTDNGMGNGTPTPVVSTTPTPVVSTTSTSSAYPASTADDAIGSSGRFGTGDSSPGTSSSGTGTL